MNVAIQGVKGSLHYIVGEQYFGEMPDLLEENKAEVLIKAIENSIAGAILPNYALNDEYKLNICVEYYLPILHNLMP